MSRPSGRLPMPLFRPSRDVANCTCLSCSELDWCFSWILDNRRGAELSIWADPLAFEGRNLSPEIIELDGLLFSKVLEDRCYSIFYSLALSFSFDVSAVPSVGWFMCLVLSSKQDGASGLASQNFIFPIKSVICHRIYFSGSWLSLSFIFSLSFP